ncbi:MAG: isoprenylcysteine carboxylmethyltransferase family protein [Roseiflexus sp.]|nr:isoprenylcysteine carboxylmethyltransferase family protein [Roseiflexus sp.]MCS7288740.1 isoprenylcysteine carboxylmethyltransferase family protein [Roseiflexus sp.]MDW8147285.1 isoprenylcysteine carboxylmethyltransferase family protein [Roseiflexaceae bacterium]MDW8233582.1 isoprenylcysteine carboxylmethyltransferase family protein [Roseiflexaceae bacterium]
MVQKVQSIIQTFTERGGWWVVIQFVLLFALALAPSELSGLPALPFLREQGALIAGFVLGGCGIALAGIGLLHLGANLTPFPRPRDDGTLIQHGVYAIVRHPIYSGIVLGAFGWSLVRGSGIALALSVVLLVFFHFKSRREERWLIERYPEYADYQKRVKKLIPFIW